MNNEVLVSSLTQYGPIALFVLLVFGIVALPIPEETLMVLSGALIKKGAFGLFPTVTAGYIGSICGISISYCLGALAGKYLLQKFEKKQWAKEHLKRVEKWFERFGKWTLLVGYFIPGVRHFTGFSAGGMKMGFRQFAVFAYTGALLWVSSFLTIGYFFGGLCFSFLEKLDVEINTLLVILGALFVLGLALLKVKHFFLKK